MNPLNRQQDFTLLAAMDGLSPEPWSAQWADNPEPLKHEGDPKVVLDTDDATADAYIFESHNSQDAWLQYEGELMERNP